jgi:hypothetical protein
MLKRTLIPAVLLALLGLEAFPSKPASKEAAPCLGRRLLRTHESGSSEYFLPAKTSTLAGALFGNWG